MRTLRNVFQAEDDIISGQLDISQGIEFKKSLTVPNQTLSPREMLERFARGVPVPGGRSTYFDGEQDINNVNPTEVRGFDLADFSALLAQTDANIKSLKAEKEKIKAAALAAKKAEEEAALRANAVSVANKGGDE